MTNSEITCFDCDGFGKIAFAFHDAKLDCRRCKGTGKCPAIMDEWRKAGELLRRARIGRDQSLREYATLIGMSPVLLSDFERGMIDPSNFQLTNQ
jgi:hypothetical protein